MKRFLIAAAIFVTIGAFGGVAEAEHCDKSPYAALEIELACPTSVTAGAALNVTATIKNYSCCSLAPPTGVTVSRFAPMLIGNAAGNVGGFGIYGPFQVYSTQTIPNATATSAPLCPNDGRVDYYNNGTPGAKTFTLGIMSAVPTALSGTMAEVVVSVTNGTGMDITGGNCMVKIN